MREIYPITLSEFYMTFNFCLKLRVTWVRPKLTQFPKLIKQESDLVHFRMLFETRFCRILNFQWKI